MSKLNILSNFVLKSINPGNLTLSHNEYLRKENNSFITTFSQLKLFAALLNERGLLKNILNLMGHLRLMNVPLVYLTETQLSSITALIDVCSTDEIVRNDDQIESLTVLYNKHNFKCLE